jgi:hypothetical protein
MTRNAEVALFALIFRSDLVIPMTKTTGIAGYLAEFANEHRAKVA